MPRKASGVPKPKPPRPLNIATHLPSDDGQLYLLCCAGWAAMKADSEGPSTSSRDLVRTASVVSQVSSSRG